VEWRNNDGFVSKGIGMAVRKKVTKRDITGEKVLTVAADLFSQKGFLATSMRDIATALKMKSGSLYYHQPSKEALLSAVLERGIKAIIAETSSAIAACGDKATVREKFRAAMIVNMRQVYSAGDVAFASERTLTYLPRASRQGQHRLRAEFAGIWRSLIQEGKVSGEIAENVNEVFAVMMILAANAFVGQWFEPSRRSFEELADQYTGILFDGYLGPRIATPATKRLRASSKSDPHNKSSRSMSARPGEKSV
jgi:AcrR family transcriptional regulator